MAEAIKFSNVRKNNNFQQKVENFKCLQLLTEKITKKKKKSKLLLPAAAANLCCTRKAQQSSAGNCCSACKHMHKRSAFCGIHFPGADTNFPNNKERRS